MSFSATFIKLFQTHLKLSGFKIFYFSSIFLSFVLMILPQLDFFAFWVKLEKDRLSILSGIN